VVDRVGIANTLGTIPEWRATASLAWSLRGYGVSTTARYAPSYDDAGLTNLANGLTVDSQTLVDLTLSLNTDELAAGGSAWAKGFVVRLGVTNLTDEEPSYSSISGIGYDTSMADVRQRFVYFALTKSF
jgi:outer membrane receptor protein involved in Fe transport